MRRIERRPRSVGHPRFHPAALAAATLVCVAVVPAQAFIPLAPTPCSGSVANLSVVTPDAYPPPYPGSQSDPPYPDPARCGNDPVSSQISRSYNQGAGGPASGIASAQCTMGEGGFHLRVHGSEEGVDNNQLGTAGNAGGSFTDSLIITGASGNGSLLLPLHVTGSSTVSFGLTSPLAPLAGGYFKLTCSSVAFVSFSCANETLSFDASQPFDATLTATVPFTFGAEVAFSRAVDAAAGFVTPYDLDHPAGPSGGLAEAAFDGTWEKATVLDAEGHEVAATISSASGFDYLNPAPEPVALAAGFAALGALLALGRIGSATRDAAAPRTPAVPPRIEPGEARAGAPESGERAS